MSETELSIDVGSSPGFDVVHVAGDLDIYTSQRFRGMLQTEPLAEPVLVLELNAVTFLDSSGVGAIVAAMREVGSRGGELVLITQGTQLLKVLRITGLHRLVSIYPSLQECMSDRSAARDR